MNAGIRWMLSTLAIAGMWSDAASAQDAPATADRVLIVQQPATVDELHEVRVLLGRPMHWIGLHCSPADETLRKQLGLPADRGLIVRDVVEDSPAAKAGIEPHDVLLTVNDQPLARPEDLLKNVGEAGKAEQELSFKLLRGGEEQTIPVQPTARPEEPVVARLRSELDPLIGERLDLHLVRPGVVVGFAGTPGAALPKDLKITITREGDQPARIKVEREGRGWWGATEKELDTLPEDVRGHVERMLGHGGAPATARTREVYQPRGSDRRYWLERTVRPYVATPTGPQPAPAGAPPAASVQKQLDELSARVKELQEAIEKLHLPREQE